MDVEDEEAWGSKSESRGEDPEDGFSMRGGAFALLGHVSAGPPEEEVKDLEEDAALAVFDQLWEQQPDPDDWSGPEDSGDPEDLGDQLQPEEPSNRKAETSFATSKGKGQGGGGWDEPSPGPPPPEDEEDVEVEVEVDCEDEEEEVEEVEELEEVEEVEELVEEIEEEPPMPPVAASASDGKAKGKAQVAPPSDDEEPEPVQEEETDDDDEEEIGISKGKAWLKGKAISGGKSIGKGESHASLGKGKEKGKNWGMDWPGKGWKGDDYWWGKGDWAKGDWRQDWNWSKGDWGSGGSEWGKGWQDWSPSRNRARDHRDDRDDQDDRDDRRRPRDSRPEPEGPPAQRRRTSSAERAPEPSSKEEWIRAQDRLFGHLKPLPNNWIRITSKSSGNIYFYNTKTGESTFEEPSGS